MTKKNPPKKVTKKKPALRKKAPIKKVNRVAKKEVSPMGASPEKLKAWLSANTDLIKIKGWERASGLPNSTLRQISSGKRKLTWEQYKIVTDKLLPKLVEITNLLVNYGKDVFLQTATA